MSGNEVTTPNEKKFRELMLYVASRCADDSDFGVIKLNKILYHADFLAYGQLGEPITGVEYVKLENGPAPRPLYPIQDRMASDGEIALENRLTRDMTIQRRVVALREPDLSGFKPEEVSLIEQIIQGFWGASGIQLSRLTHTYSGWRIAKRIGDEIPYTSVFLSDEPPTEYEHQRAEELIEEYGWSV